MKLLVKVPEAKFIWVGNGELEKQLNAKNIEVTGWKTKKHWRLQKEQMLSYFVL